MRIDQGSAGPSVDEVLDATGTGVWRWDRKAGLVTLDTRAAGLLGLPRESSTVPTSVVRARLHVADFIELSGIITLAAAEGGIAEGRLRVVGEDGRVRRTVRARLRYLDAGTPAGHPAARAAAEVLGGIGTAVDGTDAASTAADAAASPVPPGSLLLGTLVEAPETAPGPATVTGDWQRAREAFLLDAGRALAEARSTAEVLRVAATLSMPGFSPDGLAVFTVQGDRLTVIGHHGNGSFAEAPFTDLPMSTPYPATEVVRTGRAIYLADRAEYQRRFPVTWPLAARFDGHSWAFLPLIAGGRTIGAWMAAFSSPVAFTPDERSVLTTVARMLAQALSRAHVHESEQELSAGLQRTMRPAHAPQVKGMTVATRYIPTGGGLQIGGDWYDVIPLHSGRTALVIGDVQGHDVRAAGLMAQLRVALRAYASEGHSPEAVLSRASRFMAGMTRDPLDDAEASPDLEDADDPRFATCLYVEADPVAGTLDIVRAGHPDPAIRLPDGTLMVRPTAGGLPLGVDPDPDYPTTRLVLGSGETLLMCTDGLIETGGHDVDTGWARIRSVFAEHPDADLEELADALVQTVHGPPSHHFTGPLADRRDDDIALLLLSRDPVAGHVPGAGRRTVLSVAQTEASRIADARGQLRDLLYDWTAPDQVDGAVLMLSEMLTNVLVHTDGDALMLAEVTGEQGFRRLRVEVADQSDELPHRRHPGELASSGRGLILMDLLAGNWGVDPRGEGKAIWFEVGEDSPPMDWG
ncbi:SpoIIE family protein phosphatase [Streptomyces sp. JJ38]|uniref:SpoIIE family protein phosphatase n=1 Tax=Streptomyces sp. JJ38 TaxID=2738128 RepID=UPI001C574F15|nr:SpoIIE family protein phosphatase [Streptomyces sp. JJ38]MBW1596341.1 SpoIIE family protein phosphatase [Streptomyces sp. JJ38]